MFKKIIYYVMLFIGKLLLIILSANFIICVSFELMIAKIHTLILKENTWISTLKFPSHKDIIENSTRERK